MQERALPAGVVVQAGTDVDSAWDRFEVFEALHHGMRICNPMTSSDLDEVLDAVAPADDDEVLDIACGHGELLVRAAQRTRIRGVGIDLSPWVIVRADGRANSVSLRGTLEWRLADAHDLDSDELFDIVACLGASWIWHGFKGTAAAMVKRTRPGGRIVVGDLRLRTGADAAVVAETYGKVSTANAQLGVLRDLGAEVIHRLDAGDPGWGAYQERVLASVTEWALLHPGENADRYLREQRQWREDYLTDWQFLNWSVWIAQCS